MKIKSLSDTPFKEFFPSAKSIAGVLAGSADAHYGFTCTMDKPEDLHELLRLHKEGKHQYSTTEEERTERAKVPFTEFGSTFNSREEVYRVCKLLKERHGNENPDEAEAEKLIADLLTEVRART